MKARMRCFVIRKQRDEHVRNGRPKKWIAACQNCGRACSSLSHAQVPGLGGWPTSGIASVTRTSRRR